MKLSIIIVNYNVAYFLEQCLTSIFSSELNFEFDVFVVDNNSVDSSIKMISEKFPQIKLIANKTNNGFSVANNQAIKQSNSEYILLLNPDTIIEIDTLQLSVDFMETHENCGGLGVKMIDGKGKFLPESKRGLPTPSAAFSKIFGLSWLFPKSKRFSAYYLGHLDSDETNEIEILSGAFMMLRKKTLDIIGLLDEDFFMYGEDIDLSYRILKSGYKNYYFPKTRIIHFKGESTKKDSINYVFIFYKAMIIFARKHFSSKNAKIFSFLINLAIVVKASISIVKNFAKSLISSILDFGFIYLGLWFFAKYWGTHFAAQTVSYPQMFLYVIIPLFILINLTSVYYNGGYEKPVNAFKIIRGNILGALFIFVIYALLPESYRFSRALILFGVVFIPIIMILWRLIANFSGINSYKFGKHLKKRIAIIGSTKESERVIEVLDKTNLNIEESLHIDIQTDTLDRIDDIIKFNKLNEVIFCAKDFSSAEIIDMMTILQHLNIDYKIAPPESMFIIGSNSINTAGDIYFQELNTINKAENKRFKRLFDFLTSIFLIVIFPVTFFIFKFPIRYLKNLILVLISIKSIVGFDRLNSEDKFHLPNLKSGILHPSDGISDKEISYKNLMRLNMVYSREYKVSNDFIILSRGFKNLDRD
ncbi:MAG: hypothetical protein AUJ98_06975 [Bacteroidetes bacterium CG2_30_33_31]|nr:MAG: hypothetical protein AUJ98_06975 [Bacteroidetes bacterium CG2_30_33_31]